MNYAKMVKSLNNIAVRDNIRQLVRKRTCWFNMDYGHLGTVQDQGQVAVPAHGIAY